MISGQKLITACLFILFTNLFFANLSNAEENAANLYLKARSLLSELPKGFMQRTQKIIKSGWAEDDEEIKEILTKNQEAMNIFKEATKLTNCDFSFGKPIVKTLAEKIPPHLGNMFSLASLVILEGRFYERENKLDLTLENYLAILRFNKHLGQQKDFLIFNMVTKIIVENLLYIPLVEYINQQEKLNIQNYRSLLSILVSLQNNKPDLVSAFKEEGEFLRNSHKEMIDKTLWNNKHNENYHRRFFKEYDRLENEFHSYLIPAFKENNYDLYRNKINQHGEIQRTPLVELVEEHSFFTRLFPSLFAKMLFQFMPSYEKLITRYYVSFSRLKILITATAIKLYELEKREALNNLQELVPVYLEKIPEDSFDNFKHLKYEKNERGWVVYSFGPDRQDNHGSIVYDEKTKDSKGDIVFSSF